MTISARTWKLIKTVRTSYWFLPALLAAGGLAAVMVSLHLDTRFAGWWAKVLGEFPGGPEGARSILSTLAGAVITVGGLLFSIAVVVLTVAASQYGPRLVRNFLSDLVSQWAFGTFIATFLFCILALSTVGSISYGGSAFVPRLTTVLAVLLSVVSFGMLVFFVHHMASNIRVSNILNRTGSEYQHFLGHAFPNDFGDDPPRGADPDEPDVDRPLACRLTARQDGYLQAVDGSRLLKLAREKDLLIRLRARPGQFLLYSQAVADVFGDGEPDEKLLAHLQEAIVLGGDRMPMQDMEYAVNQLVEVAIRALSPGVNETFTALNSIDQLVAGLGRYLRRPTRPPQRYADGVLRVVVVPFTFEGILHASFDMIRQSASENVAASIRMLEGLAAVAPLARNPHDRELLERQGRLIRDNVWDHLACDYDRRCLEERFQGLRRELGASGTA